MSRDWQEDRNRIDTIGEYLKGNLGEYPVHAIADHWLTAYQQLEGIAQYLWRLLDDIDTATDMAKENDAWYRRQVEAIQGKRWAVGDSDGYTVTFKDVPKTGSEGTEIMDYKPEDVKELINAIKEMMDDRDYTTSCDCGMCSPFHNINAILAKFGEEFKDADFGEDEGDE